ncbi:PEP/pyruvate-binding domain-containing protein [Micromonospora sp. SH-82]|uniref:PEP/pyruvate-binding domain-containing protein n=1 Tax=Micromonospora sp. SH-82 TaxID=3132938 RepID=UPI003EBA71E9
MAAPGSEYSRRPCVYFSADAGARRPELVGGEFACMNELADEVPLPTSFCLTALSPDDLLPAETDDLRRVLAGAYARLQAITGQPDPRLVVRRSTGGPLPQPSTAPSFLDVAGLNRLTDAVHEVLRWPAPTRVLDPRLPPAALGGRGRSGVLVQVLVPAEVTAQVGPSAPGAGTRRGTDPVPSGRPDPDPLIGVRAAWGLGEGLHDEETPADTYLFTENLRLLQQRIAKKDWMTVLAEGAVMSVQVPARLRLVTCLDEEQARRVSSLYLHVRQRLRRDVRMSVASLAGDLVPIACAPVS